MHLAQNLNPNRGAHTGTQGAGKSTDGLDRAAMTANDTTSVVCSAAYLDKSSVCTIGHIERDRLLVLHEATDDVLNQVGDRIGRHLLDGVVDLVSHGLLFLGSSLSSSLGGSLSSGSGLGSLLLGKLLLLLGSGSTLTDDVDEVRDGVGRLGALSDPLVDLLEIELNGLGGGQRVVATNQLDEATIATGAAVSDDNAVVRTLLGTVTGQANLDCQ